MTLSRFSLFFVFLVLPLSAWGKVEVTGGEKPATNPDHVKIVSYDKGQFKECEEIGIIHSKAFWGGYSTKKGMLKRMKKQAAKVGATHILLANTGHGDYSGSNVGNGTVFYCPAGVAQTATHGTQAPSHAEAKEDPESDPQPAAAPSNGQASGTATTPYVTTY